MYFYRNNKPALTAQGQSRTPTDVELDGADISRYQGGATLQLSWTTNPNLCALTSLFK